MACQRDGLVVAAELLNVLLDPVQSGHLIHESIVGDARSQVRTGIGVQETYMWRAK